MHLPPRQRDTHFPFHFLTRAQSPKHPSPILFIAPNGRHYSPYRKPLRAPRPAPPFPQTPTSCPTVVFMAAAATPPASPTRSPSPSIPSLTPSPKPSLPSAGSFPRHLSPGAPPLPTPSTSGLTFGTCATLRILRSCKPRGSRRLYRPCGRYWRMRRRGLGADGRGSSWRGSAWRRDERPHVVQLGRAAARRLPGLLVPVPLRGKDAHGDAGCPGVGGLASA
ncbi:hypothetical protein VUR80DRAFT_40 [Thermomyces stellatus]